MPSVRRGGGAPGPRAPTRPEHPRLTAPRRRYKQVDLQRARCNWGQGCGDGLSCQASVSTVLTQTESRSADPRAVPGAVPQVRSSLKSSDYTVFHNRNTQY